MIVFHREAATGAPHRALPLDNIISSMIEPTLSAADKSRRESAKVDWQKQADKTMTRWKQKMNPAARAAAAPNHMHLPGGLHIPGLAGANAMHPACLFWHAFPLLCV